MNNFQTKYQIVSKIGEGTFSDVIKCVEKGSGKEFAAKRLKRICRTNENMEKYAEITAWRKIPKHDNVLNMLEYYFDLFTGQIIFIFELMDMSLFEYMSHKKHSFSEEKSKILMFQMISGIDHIHKSGFFHRDIKPENILIRFINEGENLKVADLGSIRGTYSVHPYTEYISTRWYRSPECLLTVGHYTSKMDIWAAACVFYEMLTFKPLFPGANEIDQLAKIHKVLGVPNANTLNKLKPKSKNYIHFPYTKGLGIYAILPKASLECRLILEQMLEYDPFKRTNAKRLLRHSYFHRLKIEPKQKKSKLITEDLNMLAHTNKRTFGKSQSFVENTGRAEPKPRNHPRSQSMDNKNAKKNNKSNSVQGLRTTFEKFILAIQTADQCKPIKQKRTKKR